MGKLFLFLKLPDDVFSAKMMGDGFAVVPTDGEVSTPVAGKITSIFPTKHALGIQTDSGIEVLLHMGLDTVELQGGPFTLHVEEGQVVKQGDKIATIDLAALEQAGKIRFNCCFHKSRYCCSIRFTKSRSNDFNE